MMGSSESEHVMAALRSDAYYVHLAEDAIRTTSIGEPPISVSRLAECYGIPVRMVTFPAFFSGAIINEDGLPVILLNTTNDEDEQRKTLAHLVGHVLIVLGDPTEGYPRNTEMEHKDADRVADELIMPSGMVGEQAAKWFNDHRYLARLFGVQEQEMMRKLLEMGIIKQHGIMWDY